MSADEQEAGEDWRADAGWRLVYGDADAPAQPPPEAELAQPPVWASLFENRTLVACWWRPVARDAKPDPPAE